MGLFRQALKWQGYPLDEAGQTLESLRRLPQRDFISWQNQQKWAIFNHHFAQTEWYKHKMAGPPEIWSDIPILQKKDYQHSISALLSSSFHPGQVYIGSTSGSSGHPFFYAKDKFCHALTWVKVEQLYRQYGIDFNALQARFYGIPLDWKGWLKETLKDYISRRRRFPVFDLSDEVLNTWKNRFRKLPFDYLYGYTSSLVYFARFLIQRKENLKTICPSLKVCIVTSEACTAEDREILETGFGIPVVNEYGASELSIIAFEMPDDAWAITEDLVFVEVVDEDGNPVPDGSPGRILCTALFNKAMPIIRYEIGDIGAIDHKDGKARLIELLGRVNDFARLPSGKVSPGLTFYYISRSILEKAGFINEFIIEQIELNKMRFVINANRPITAQEKALIEQRMDKYLEPGRELEIVETAQIERLASGKIKHFYSLLNP